MNRTPPEKWLQNVSAHDRTAEVAEQALQSRLRAVLYYLPLAAETADDDSEYVHQLRVWTRRAVAALRLYEELIPKRRMSWMEKQLKRIRHSADAARDLDVLIARLAKKQTSQRDHRRWLKAVRADRREVQKAIVAVYARLRHDKRLARRIDKLLARVHARGAETNGRPVPLPLFGEWARQRLRSQVKAFFAAIPTDELDEKALHQFRIRSKELRYALELLADAFAPTVRTTLYPAVEALQDRLGALNDLATACGRLQQKIDSAPNAHAAALWRRLLANEQMQCQRARKEFWGWFTADFVRGLRDQLQAVLAASAAVLFSPCL